MKKLLLPLFLLPAIIQAQVVRLDFDKSGRQSSEVTQPGFTPWIVTEATSEITENGITFSLATGENSDGSSFKNNWYKAGIQTPYYARLVCDGVMVSGGDTGASIVLTINGLETGEHSILTYHNQVDGLDVATIAGIDITVDGTQVAENEAQTCRKLSNAESAAVYLKFNAQSGKPVVITYSTSKAGQSKSYRNVIINGIVLNEPNVFKQAFSPLPADGDLHVDADNGSAVLSWTVPADALSHDLYFGTDSVQVYDADKTSALYKGSLCTASFQTSDLHNRHIYYWRVDETDASGELTKGAVWSFSPRQLAFPGAEGYGRYARGGRGGKVVYVTNLNDDGPGSLREAVTSDIGPRVVMFAVSGIIQLKSRLTLGNSNVTIAGQTAPSKGICIKSAPFGLSGADDCIMRFMRVRLGGGETYDGMGLNGSDYCIFDHNSISWTIDEAFSSRSAKNITLQRTLISEALNAAGHKNYPAGTQHGYAASISGDIGSFHHNLLAHCAGRNWSLAGGLDGDGYYSGRLDIFNNVVYNWSTRTTDGGAHEVNFVNNYYKPGPASSQKYALNAQFDGFPGTQQYYCSGNIVEGWFENLSDPKNGCKSDSSNPDPWVGSAFFESYAQTQTAKNAYKNVLSDVGCTMPVFDDHDIRVVKETLNKSYSCTGSVTGKKGLPDNEQDVGGWEDYPQQYRLEGFDSDKDGLPDWWERLMGSDPESASGDFSDSNAYYKESDGYTALDWYLHWMATAHYDITAGQQKQISLLPFSAGYESGVTYKVCSVSGFVGNTLDSQTVSAVISGSDLKINAAQGFNGLVSVKIEISDSADGSAVTREIGLNISSTTSFENVVTLQPVELNPSLVEDVVNISLNGTESALVNIVSMSGSAVARYPVSSSDSTLDLSMLQSGIYVVEVKTVNGTYRFRILKK